MRILKQIMDSVKFCLFVAWFCFYLFTDSSVFADWRVKKSCKILQSEPVELGQSVLLRTEEIPNLTIPFHWECGPKRFQCEITCLNHSHFKVTNNGNSSTLWMWKVTKECLKLDFIQGDYDILGTVEIQLKTTTAATTANATAATSGFASGTSLCIFIAILVAVILQLWNI